MKDLMKWHMKHELRRVMRSGRCTNTLFLFAEEKIVLAFKEVLSDIRQGAVPSWFKGAEVIESRGLLITWPGLLGFDYRAVCINPGTEGQNLLGQHVDEVIGFGVFTKNQLSQLGGCKNPGCVQHWHSEMPGCFQ